MTNFAGKCMVCGARPTVRSHLFPRAFAHQIRGEEKNLIEGDRVNPGVRLRQAGLWDDGIVCEKHEAAFASADDYAVRFSRRFPKLAILSETGNSYTVPNPRPDLLLRFVCATVWRHVVSRHGAGHALDLGPYRALIEQHLFCGADMPLQVLVGRSNLIDPKGERIEFGLAPYKRKLRDWTVWHFTIGGFDFFLKADQRPFPSQWKELLANDNDPLTVPLTDPRPFYEVPMFQPILRNMLK